MNPLPGGFDIDFDLLLAVRAIIPGAALLLLVRDLTSREARTQAWRIGLIAVGTLSFLAW